MNGTHSWPWKKAAAFLCPLSTPPPSPAFSPTLVTTNLARASGPRDGDLVRVACDFLTAAVDVAGVCWIVAKGGSTRDHAIIEAALIRLVLFVHGRDGVQDRIQSVGEGIREERKQAARGVFK